MDSPGNETKPDPKKVSIIIAVYNGMAYVDRCLEAVLAQDYPCSEVIYVDNASTDGGLEHVRRRFPEVLTVSSPRNLGYAGGINKGLERAAGYYIAPLNVDTEVAPGWLRRMVAFSETHPSVGAVTPMILIDQQRDRVNALGGAIHVSGLSFCKGLNQPRDHVPPSPFPVAGVSGASYLIRRTLMTQMGGAPAHCFMGNDDVLLSWTLRLMGFEIYCVPESIVYHDYRLTLDPEKLYLLERNRHDMLLSSLRAGTLLTTLPFTVALEAAILGYCALRGRPHLEAKLKAYRALWKDRHGTRARRRQLQALRAVSDWKLLGSMEKVPEWRQLVRLLVRSRSIPVLKIGQPASLNCRQAQSKPT